MTVRAAQSRGTAPRYRSPSRESSAAQALQAEQGHGYSVYHNDTYEHVQLDMYNVHSSMVLRVYSRGD